MHSVDGARARSSKPVLALAVIAFAGVLFVATPSIAVNDVAGELKLFNNNGAWSWFEDERAIVDTVAGKIIVSSVANGGGTGGAARHGDVEVVALDIASGAATAPFTLSNALQADDHNSAALWRRPDGRYLAMYSTHNADDFSRHRRSTSAGDATGWDAEVSFDNGARATYSNLHYLPNDNSGAGRLVNFTRSVGWDPNILVSNDLGNTWSYGGRLLAEGGDADRPYLRYYSDGQRIHFIATERHPRNFDNSIYHGYVQDGKLYNSQGAVLDANLFDASAVAPTALTQIFATGTTFGGVEMRRAWTVDIAIDDAGRPYAVFQARANNSTADHRFFYARFDGTNWSVNELAKAGGFLYSAENDYTGLVALDPSDPNRLFMSTTIDPRDQSPLEHYEIFEGNTTNGGASWTWSAITSGSTVDNVRPIVPEWDEDHTALLWMRGIYSTYTNYDLNIVGLTGTAPLVETPDADLNYDGELDLDDFSLFLSGLHADLSGLSWDQAYRKGDLNGDKKNNHADFLLFREAYDLAHGAGAFAAAQGQLPEPTSAAIALFMGFLVIGFRGRCWPGRRGTFLGMALAMAIGATDEFACGTPFLAVDMNDRTLVDAPNTVAGFSSFTLPGTIAAVSVPVTQVIGAYTVTMAPWDDGTDGNPAGAIDDRDRAVPVNGGALSYAQIYDDLIFAGNSVGLSGGIDLSVSGGALQPNTEYTISIYSCDGEAAGGTTRRTATWRDLNNTSAFVLQTNWVDDVPPVNNDAYKFSGAVLTDEMGKLSLRGRRDPQDSTQTPPVNDGPSVYINGFEINEFVPPVELTLEVNTTTGAVRLANQQSIAIDMNYYEVRSPAGSLNPAGWTSLDDAEGDDPPGTGWDESPNINAKLLNEIRLQATTTFTAFSSASLGFAFTPDGTRDVQFFYSGAETPLREGILKYVQGVVLAGDYNNNGTVDAADYATWRDKLDTPAVLANDTTPGMVTQDDYEVWRANFGRTGGSTVSPASAAGVPEPYAIGLLLSGVAGILVTDCRGRQRG